MNILEVKQMAHTYSNINIHYIFSTKKRGKLLTPGLQKRLWPYMGGIARENKMKALVIGGTVDHVHLLISLPTTITIAKGIQLIKGGSSKWVHDTFHDLSNFQWQEGYGAFSVDYSNINNIIKYIKNQHEHHRKKSFEEEYVLFLNKYGIKFDDKYVFE